MRDLRQEKNERQESDQSPASLWKRQHGARISRTRWTEIARSDAEVVAVSILLKDAQATSGPGRRWVCGQSSVFALDLEPPKRP